MNEKLPLILALTMAVFGIGLYILFGASHCYYCETETISVVEGKLADVPESLRPTTVVEDKLADCGFAFIEDKLADVPESLRPTTYTPPNNIYLPEMMFLVTKDTDKPAIARCKNMAFRIVDSFSRQVNSNLVRADKKLYALARIVYSECIDVVLITYQEGI